MSSIAERERPGGSKRSSLTLTPSDILSPAEKQALQLEVPESALEKEQEQEQPAAEGVPTLLPAIAPVGCPPDGGREAWFVVAGAAAIMFCTFGFTTSFGELQQYYLENQLSGYSKATVSWISSIQSTLPFALALPIGRHFDTHGLRALTIGFVVLNLSALVGVAFCHAFWHFLLAHTLYGTAASLVFAPSIAVMKQWFARRKTRAQGLALAGAGAGGVVYPIMISRLLALLRFRDAILCVAALNAALLLPVPFIFRARAPPRASAPLRHLLQPFREIPYLLIILGSGFMMLACYSPFFHAPSYATSNSLTPRIAQYSVAILQSGSIAGRILAGVLADRIGPLRAFCGASLAVSLVILALWTPVVGPAGCVVGMVFFGATAGGWATVQGAAVGTVSPPGEYGARLGLCWTLASPGMLVGPVISGALISAGGDKFEYAALFCGPTFLVGSLIVCGLWYRTSRLARLDAAPAVPA